MLVFCMPTERYIDVSSRLRACNITLLGADTDLEVDVRLQQLPEAPPVPAADLEYVSDDEQTSSLLCAMPDRVRRAVLCADICKQPCGTCDV